MNEKMTWKEIQEKYPDRWVALTDVTYLNNDNCNIESAIVVCVMSDEEYIAKRLSLINEGKNYEYTRTTDSDGIAINQIMIVKPNVRVVAALNRAIELKPDIEIGKFIRYVGSISDLAYMSDEDLAIQIEGYNHMAEKGYSGWRYKFEPTDVHFIDENDDNPFSDFTKENEQISYDRYKKRTEGFCFYELTEKLSMSDFLKRAGEQYWFPENSRNIEVINHLSDFLVWWNKNYRHMNGYFVARKGDKYIAKHIYLVKIPTFGEIIDYMMGACIGDYDDSLVIAIDWHESPRFIDYTSHIMFGLSYRIKEEVVEIYNENQTIEKFHEYMQRANKIISNWKGVLYDDGTFEGN